MNDIRRSKRLSLWLRHDPGAGGLTLDGQGWTDVRAVLGAFARAGVRCDRNDLMRLVEECDKQRFELSGDAARIRARQGHSVEVALDWPRADPPELLWHGTVERFLPMILAEGLKPMRRHHVHLSGERDTATRVGQRRGTAVILAVRAAALAETGRDFFVTSNGVWLTEQVPPAFLEPWEPK
ncbi:putative RNA 2'-phosphotransferase [Sphingomonas leidyi]|uniref:Probable RNA 2'-phosphotransferase n=1 Tax=Sphingomonas leidyi TaxID=68569 RepID=A0A7X5V2H5_9SPHN|nr:putative RNA 2'-phosphotransferase [Sphingomonas leidyi]